MRLQLKKLYCTVLLFSGRVGRNYLLELLCGKVLSHQLLIYLTIILLLPSNQ